MMRFCCCSAACLQAMQELQGAGVLPAEMGGGLGGLGGGLPGGGR